MGVRLSTWPLGPPSGAVPAVRVHLLIPPFSGPRQLSSISKLVYSPQRAFKKIRASLGPEALKCVDRFAGLFRQTLVGRSDYSQKSELIDDLVVAAQDCRAVFITYQSQRATEPTTYDVYPYGLIYHRGSLYLVGWAPQHEEIRHWKVDRIEALELTPIHFQRPESFDLDRHLADSFGIFQGKGSYHLRIRFSREVARYVQEKSWHPSQKLSPQKDGSLSAEFDLGDTEEIKRWILSFGRNAEVLEPEGLRREIQEEVQTLMTTYEGRGPSGHAKPKEGRERSIHR